jgi:multimeric flavodoxin WrbA
MLVINGSPRDTGACYHLSEYIKKTAEENGINCDIFSLKNAPVGGCKGCKICKKNGICFMDDIASELSRIIDKYDGYIFISPVHYAGISGNIKTTLDRLLFMAGEKMRYKPAGAICIARRAGCVGASEEITRHFIFNSMPVAPSNYFTVFYAKTKQELYKDTEGLQTARVLTKNLIWLMRLIENGKENGILPPKHEEKIKVGFLD